MRGDGDGVDKNCDGGDVEMAGKWRKWSALSAR